MYGAFTEVDEIDEGVKTFKIEGEGKNESQSDISVPKIVVNSKEPSVKAESMIKASKEEHEFPTKSEVSFAKSEQSIYEKDTEISKLKIALKQAKDD